ncbi:MAG TPA: hypothetical protein PLU87_20245 [Sedimentisphaerales bacterium]|nr:hypothetical protein [Sedimentisphaerales bacterium]HRS11291.1 hypothetical protein [Sedimentisphaerales bacterium]HRV49990.1 hypothetical protein [Sedimentisphaerales bacterium]
MLREHRWSSYRSYIGCDQVRLLYHRRLDAGSRQEDIAFRRPGTVLSAEAIVAVVCRHRKVERGASLRRRRNSFDRAIAARMLCDYGGLRMS